MPPVTQDAIFFHILILYQERNELEISHTLL